MRMWPLVVVGLSGCLPVINANAVVSRATENEAAAARETLRTKIRIEGEVTDISAGQRPRLVAESSEQRTVTTLEAIHGPFATFNVNGTVVIARLSDDEDGSTLQLGRQGELLCRFERFDRSASGQRVLVLEYCRAP